MNPVTFYKTLADDTRLRCLLLISREQELCVCELMSALDDSQPKISRHLALLRKAGILSDRRQGQWVYYRLADTLPAWAVQVLHLSLQHNEPWLEHAVSRLCQMGERPARQNNCC